MPRRKPSEALDAVVQAGKSIDVGELAEELLAAFGGARSFAHSYHHEFAEGSKAGSISRSKMLDGVLRIVAQATTANKGKDNVTSMSDDDLADEIVRLLAQRGVKVEN